MPVLVADPAEAFEPPDPADPTALVEAAEPAEPVDPPEPFEALDAGDPFEFTLAEAALPALVLLVVLSKGNEPMYGYQIAKRLEQSAGGALSGKQSALYPVLRNLCAAGLLKSHVEPSVSGPPRRYYAITALGRAAAEEWTATWTATRKFVDSVLRGAV